MAKGKAVRKFFKGAGKVVGGAFKAVGGLVMDGLKSLTKGGKSESKVTAGESSKTSNDVKTEVSKLTNTKPEPDKLAEQDNRAAEAEVQASKVTESKSRNDKNQAQSISSRTRSILQNYGLKGELVRSIKKSAKDEVKSEASSVVSRSDIFNIYQQKAPNVNIDKVVEMLAANNEILANVNETIRLIHNQGTIETEFKKIKGEKAKVLSEKAKDEAESVNKSTDKSGQKIAEYKAQALAIRDALHDDLSKSSGASSDQMNKMLELMAQQQVAKEKEDEDSDGLMGLLGGGLLSVLPMLLDFLPTGLISKGAGFLSKAFGKLKSTVGGAWDGLKSMVGFGEKSAAKGAAEVATKDAVKTTASKKVAKTGLKEFFKKLSPKALKVITKKFIARAVLKAAAKGAGKAALKKVPIAGAVAGLGFGIERCLGDKPDYAGAGLEIVSGIASIFPGIGTGISAAIDVASIVRDVNNAIDDMKNGEIDPDMFTDEELAEILVEPTQEELELDAAQEANESKQNNIDLHLAAIPGFGQVAAGLRYGYRYLKNNGIIEGNSTLDKLAGVKSNEELKAEIAEKKSAKSGGSGGWTPSTTPVHKEAKASNKVFKGVSVLDNNKSGPDGSEMELGESGGDFTLSSEQRELMNYWKDHKANPTDPEAAQRLVDYWKSYEGKLSYSQEVRDINQGSTDCSGMVANSLQNVFGMNVDDGTGTYAAALATNKIGAVVTQSDVDESGNGSGKLTPEMIEQLQPGDVIYTRLDKWKGKRPYAVGHASLYIGNGKVLSQGGLKDGPYQTDLSYYDGKFVLAKRYFGTGNAEVSKADIESTSSASASSRSLSSSERMAKSISNVVSKAVNATFSSSNNSMSKPTTTSGSTSQLSKSLGSSQSSGSSPVNMKDDHSVNDNSSTVNNYNYTYNINNGASGTPDLKQMS